MEKEHDYEIIAALTSIVLREPLTDTETRTIDDFANISPEHRAFCSDIIETAGLQDVIIALRNMALKKPLTDSEQRIIADFSGKSVEHNSLVEMLNSPKRIRRILETRRREYRKPPTMEMWKEVNAYMRENGGSPIELARIDNGPRYIGRKLFEKVKRVLSRIMQAFR